ncbi:MAG TPA: hypothetical protein VGR51_05675 [Thermoplasmata archaeon]|nr:hypothetical protein [Thermoplasmata archaeon]
MWVRRHGWDAFVGVLSFAGIAYLYLSIREPWYSNAYPGGIFVCGLLWLPAIALLYIRITSQPPVRGKVF